MLAATSRRAARRTFATVAVDGVKAAAFDNGQPTAAVTFLVKGGSRFESKPGVAHALKNFAFKSTAKRSALGTVRESELYGGVLSASLSREHLALTAEFLRGDEPFFIDLLSSFATSAKFTRHELEEYVHPVVEAESLAASADPGTHAIELAHALAFRTGLGASLFAPAHNTVTAPDVAAFAASAFAADNIAVLGTGIAPELLAKLLSTTSFKSSSSTASSAAKSVYYGGETRVSAHGGLPTVFIGFGVPGAPSPALAALAHYLAPPPSIKWSAGLSPIAGVPAGTSVRTVALPYSDATLFGLLVQGADVRAAGRAAVGALKEVAQKGLGEEALRGAVARAKFGAASALETRDGLVHLLGSKILAGAEPSLDGSFSSLDSLDAAAFTKAVSTLAAAKPTYVAVGDIQTLPYADELGL